MAETRGSRTGSAGAAPPAIERTDGRKTRGTRDESLVAQVRRTILSEIVQGKLAPGTVMRLPDLADRYGVSRTPVREALAVLGREGLISSIPYKGYLVRPIETHDVSDVFFMRRLLEPPAAELAAARLGPEEIDRLQQALTRHPPPTTAAMTLQFDEHNHDFHRTIVLAAGSPRLFTTFEAVYNDVRRLQYAGIGKPCPELIHQEHVEILEALSRGDGAAARALMGGHIDAMRRRAFEAWAGGHGPADQDVPGDPTPD